MLALPGKGLKMFCDFIIPLGSIIQCRGCNVAREVLVEQACLMECICIILVLTLCIAQVRECSCSPVFLFPFQCYDQSLVN